MWGAQVREVLFINEVDAQNRKLSLEQRMGQTESRRQEYLDTIRNRHKEVRRAPVLAVFETTEPRTLRSRHDSAWWEPPLLCQRVSRGLYASNAFWRANRASKHPSCRRSASAAGA